VTKAQGATIASKVLMLEIHLLALMLDLWEGAVYRGSFTAYTGLNTSINLEHHVTHRFPGRILVINPDQV
jgi:hypothetical protein